MRNDVPRVSIVVPSFNQAPFICDTIASILAQDYPNLEVIVMDGGSTDGTLAALEMFGDRIAVHSSRDQGQSDAVNRGFSLATGAIIGWLNSDDLYLFRDTVSHACRYMSEHPEIDAAFGDYVRVDETGRFIRAYRVWRSYDRERLLRLCYISQPTVFFRRHLIEAVKLDEALHFGMDIDLWLNLAERGYLMGHQGRFVAAERIHSHAKTVRNSECSAKEGLAVRARHALVGEDDRALRRTFGDRAALAAFRILSLLPMLQFRILGTPFTKLELPPLAILVRRQLIG